MADLNYKVKVDTAQAQSNLKGLKAQVGGLGTAFKALALGFVVKSTIDAIRTFQDLKQVLKTVEGDATKAAKSFELIKKFTAQTTFQLDEVTQAFITFRNAGLNPTEDFMRNIGNIAAGMDRRLDEVARAVFNATTGEFEMLKNLGIKVKTEGNKLTVNFKGIVKTIDNDGKSIVNLINEIGKVNFASGIENAAATMSGAISNLDDQIKILQNDIGEGGLTQAVTDVIRSMTAAAGKGESLAKTLGAGLGRAVRFVADNFKLLAIAVGVFIGGAVVTRVVAMVTAFIAMAKAIKAAVVTMYALNAAMGKNLFYKVAQGIVLLGGALAAYFGSSKDAVAETADGLKELDKQLKEIQKGSDGDFLGDLGKGGMGIDEGTQTKITKYSNSISDLVDNYKASNAETLRSLDLNSKMLGMSEEQVLIQEALSRESEKYADRLREIARARKDAQDMADGPEKVARLKTLAEAEAALTAEYDAQIPVIEAKAKAQYKEIQNTRFLNYQIDEQNKNLKQVRQIQDDTRRLTMTALEKKYYDIQVAARESAEEQIEQWAKAQNMMRSEVDPAVVKKFYDEAFKGQDRLTRATKRNYEQARTFSTGWKRAFNDYVEAATDAAAKAERIFGKLTSGMEDMIVNFVKTGKFEWRDFVNSMLEEIFRSNLQTLMAKLFQGVGLGDLFGGSKAPTGASNNPLYVVPMGGGALGGGGMGGLGGILGGGSSGGGSSSGGGIGSILGKVGSIFTGTGRTPDFNPNTTPGGGGIMGGVTNVVKTIGKGIGSVAKGVGGVLGSIGKGLGSIFGGFFANGGTLPAGKIGIVGERGPEFISGPATVTPMGGGTTVNYNINAVDAMSFKQMIARDPSFIYAVTEQGRKSVPAMAR